jgi:rod shape-determining protein MreB
MFNFSSTKNLAIDLGNNNTLLSDQSTILLSQPSFMIVNELNNNVEAVGDEAYKMLEKTHSNLKPVR